MGYLNLGSPTLIASFWGRVLLGIWVLGIWVPIIMVIKLYFSGLENHFAIRSGIKLYYSLRLFVATSRL